MQHENDFYIFVPSDVDILAFIN